MIQASKKINDCIEFSGRVVHETANAVLFEFHLEFDSKELWIPYSQVDYLLRGKSTEQKDKIRIKEWIAKKKNLIEVEE